MVLTRLAGVPTDEADGRIADSPARPGGGAGDHGGAGRGGAAEPAAAHAVRDRAAAGHPVETVVVRVTDSDGRVGLGEAPENWPVLGSSVAGSAACLEGPLRDAVLGRSADPTTPGR